MMTTIHYTDRNGFPRSRITPPWKWTIAYDPEARTACVVEGEPDGWFWGSNERGTIERRCDGLNAAARLVKPGSTVREWSRDARMAAYYEPPEVAAPIIFGETAMISSRPSSRLDSETAHIRASLA
jgi:hypothetical protein